MSDESQTVAAVMPDAGGGAAGEDATPSRRTASSRLPAIGIALATFAAGGALALVAHNISDRQEHTLLEERTNEVTTILSTAVNDARTNLRDAGAAAVAQGQSTLFTTMVVPSTLTGGRVVAAEQQGDSFTTIAQAGKDAPAVGSAISDDAAAIARRALTSKDMVSGIVDSGAGRRIILALNAHGERPTVVYIDSPLPGASEAPTDPDSPYRELNVALYAGKAQDADTLVLASGDVPRAGGDTVTRTFDVGAEKWLLAVSEHCWRSRSGSSSRS